MLKTTLTTDGTVEHPRPDIVPERTNPTPGRWARPSAVRTAIAILAIGLSVGGTRAAFGNPDATPASVNKLDPVESRFDKDLVESRFGSQGANLDPNQIMTILDLQTEIEAHYGMGTTSLDPAQAMTRVDLVSTPD